ncbi:MAG: CHRD domain-containing protein, partial [Gammaproteobacteria bacterium]|nr:CHRD domain-containing protein [Gammaproteobacteria bacterium]
MRALSSTVLTAFLLTSLVACGGGGSGSDTVIGATPPLLVASTLTQREVIPPSGSAATGEANFAVNLDDDSLSGDVVLTALQASAVDIRDSFAGEKGTLVLALEQGVDASQWRVPDGTRLTVGDLSRLQSGALYVAATGVGPEIDIRGQLIPSGVDLMLADMTGSQEVPALQVASSGVAAMTVDTATRVAQMHVNVIDTASPVIAAHMHQAFAGDNGGVEVGLQEDMMTMAGDPAHWFATDVQLTDAQYQRLRRGESYFNAHTPNHPGGEVRGQIIPPDIELFFDDLSGLQVVGDGITISAVNTTASAKASTTVDTAAQSITVYVNTSELDDAHEVALHQAPEGQNGPAVATFVEEPDDDDPDDG